MQEIDLKPIRAPTLRGVLSITNPAALRGEQEGEPPIDSYRRSSRDRGPNQAQPCDKGKRPRRLQSQQAASQTSSPLILQARSFDRSQTYAVEESTGAGVRLPRPAETYIEFNQGIPCERKNGVASGLRGWSL
jgi:hypothetical protein